MFVSFFPTCLLFIFVFGIIYFYLLVYYIVLAGHNIFIIITIILIIMSIITIIINRKEKVKKASIYQHAVPICIHRSHELLKQKIKTKLLQLTSHRLNDHNKNRECIYIKSHYYHYYIPTEY